MKIFKSFIAFAGMIGLMSLASCTDDWGKQDPPAGTDVYPTKELVTTYNFEYADAEPLSDLSQYVGDVSVAQDEVLGSNVLHLGEGGYVRIANPFVGSKGLQNGAAITMWLRTDSVTRHPSFIAFGDENHFGETETEQFTFTENSWLSYTKPGQLETLNLDENNPEKVVTGAIANDQQWHFFALQITSDGYALYIDGEKKAQQDKYAERNTQFSYSNLLKYLETAPYIYIGTPNEPYLAVTDVDDITFYRNQMDQKDWNKSLNGGGDGGFVYERFFLVGAEDNSSGFFGPKTPNMTLNGDGVMHYKFKVKSTKGVNNWETWVLAITNGVEFGGNGYVEYEICRGDAWCWGSLLPADGAGVTQSYNWDTWKTDMAGATVELFITRTGNAFHVDQYVTTAGGTALPVCTWDSQGASGATWGTFVTLEACCLEFDKEECYAATTYAPGTKIVGNTDLTSPFFDAKSDVYTFDDVAVKRAVKFVNYSAMGANWENYVVAFTNDVAFGGDGYHEYAVLRSDAYGWGDQHNAEHIGASYNWDTYTTDMNGAQVTLEFTRINDRFDMVAKQISSGGSAMPDMTYYFDDTVLETTTPMHVFITGEHNYMDFLEVREYPFMKYTPEE